MENLYKIELLARERRRKLLQEAQDWQLVRNTLKPRGLFTQPSFPGHILRVLTKTFKLRKMRV